MQNRLTRIHFREFTEGILNSYAQIFFAKNPVLALALIAVSFLTLFSGLSGFLAVVFTLGTGLLFRLDRKTLYSGVYGFNSLLVGLGLGLYFTPTPGYFLILFLASVLTLFIAVSLQGVIGKYGLPFLSIPFILGVWIILLATRQFENLGISERGIFRLNELYNIGGSWLVNFYESIHKWVFPSTMKLYFMSLGAIVFQPNVLAGILIATGLLCYSRIAFTLSLLGFYTAYLFYLLLGINLAETSYSYIGFNYILTAIALGGYFLVPSGWTYLWILLLTPLVAILTISADSVFNVFRLPVYALPFNLIVLLFLYVLKFRTGENLRLREVFIQQFIPEQNLYAYQNNLLRFDYRFAFSFRLPFWGKWKVSQGHNGVHTHKDEWKHAWDFEISDEEGKTFKGSGNQLADYYCYGKDVIAPAGGIVEEVVDDIDDNQVGDVNLIHNWGNTVVIRHADTLYSKLSHLRKDSVTVTRGQHIMAGEVVGKTGNSGRSPFPHLHFQFQATPYIGSKTIYYPFAQYLRYDKNIPDFKTYAIPVEDELVSNIDPNPLLKKALHLIPGQKLRFSVSGTVLHEEIILQAEADAYNQTWLVNQTTGSRAAFVSDDLQFYFTYYEGKRTDILYYFFLGLYRVPKGYYQDMEVRDTIPLHQVQKPRQRILQDFLAPFLLYHKAEFVLSYVDIDNPVLTQRIILSSRINLKRMHRESEGFAFSIVFESGTIQQIKVNTRHNNIILSCIG
ncbi:MAG: peptidoglycan DD-metalloendopeptidase family protein [Chlorobi bacterium]|nr:peptidoglycan DD-metalloendopeptidase family protein [Chlorobiota bacterium]